MCQDDKRQLHIHTVILYLEYVSKHIISKSILRHDEVNKISDAKLSFKKCLHESGPKCGNLTLFVIIIHKLFMSLKWTLFCVNCRYVKLAHSIDDSVKLKIISYICNSFCVPLTWLYVMMMGKKSHIFYALYSL